MCDMNPTSESQPAEPMIQPGAPAPTQPVTPTSQPAPAPSQPTTPPRPQPSPLEAVMLQNQKLLKKQLLHSRLRTLILFLILAVVTFSAFFIRGKVSEAMETFHDVTETLDETAERVQGAMATIESMNTTIDGVEVVIVQVREILDDLDLEAINTTVQNMESVSAALDRDIQAINIDELESAIENLNGVATVLNNAAQKLSEIGDFFSGR